MFVEQNLSRFIAVFSGSRGELRRQSLRHGKEHHCGTAQRKGLHSGSTARNDHRRVDRGNEGWVRAACTQKQWCCDLEQNTKGYQKDHGLFAVQGFFEWVSSPHFLPMILPDSSTNCNNQGGFPEASLGCKASITLWKYAIHFLLSRVGFLYMLCFQGNSMKLMWRRDAFPFRLSIPLRMSLLGDSAQWSLWRGEAEWSPDDRRVYPRLCQSAGTLEKNENQNTAVIEA